MIETQEARTTLLELSKIRLIGTIEAESTVIQLTKRDLKMIIPFEDRFIDLDLILDGWIDGKDYIFMSEVFYD
jgi:hypothetical protein